MTDLLEIACEKTVEAKVTGDKHAWCVIISFLWTTWHRKMVLFCAHILEWVIGWGGWPGGFFNSIQGLRPLPAAITILNQPLLPTSQSDRDLQLREYIYRCAFDIIYKDRGALGLDFRMFCKRYTELPFGNRNGNREHCQRF